jgi:VanZ family protein
VAFLTLRHHRRRLMTAPRKFLAWLPAILWAATVFFLSAQPTLPEIAPNIWNFDKVEHFGAYGLLGLLVADALRRAGARTLPKTALLAILITSAYGASDEFHQRFVPNRTCDVWDWAADTAGGALAVVVYAAYESRRSQKANR